MPEPESAFAALLRNPNTLNAMVFLFTGRRGIQNIPANSQKLQAIHLPLIRYRIRKRIVDYFFQVAWQAFPIGVFVNAGGGSPSSIHLRRALGLRGTNDYISCEAYNPCITLAYKAASPIVPVTRQLLAPEPLWQLEWDRPRLCIEWRHLSR